MAPTAEWAASLEPKHRQPRIISRVCAEEVQQELKAARSVVISEPDWDHLRRSLFTPDGAENAAFALCGYFKEGDDFQLLVRKVVDVPLEAYRDRTEYHLDVSPAFINSLVDLTESKFAILVMHSHRGGYPPRYSASDNFGEARLLKVFDELVPGAPHSSLLFTEGAVIIGRFLKRKRFQPIAEVLVKGRSLRAVGENGRKGLQGDDGGRYDRQTRAFGDEFQTAIRGLKVGIVGVGGTGSAVAEQLARIGCQSFVFIDPDKFERSNESRMYGSFSGNHPTEYKTAIVKRHVENINPDVGVQEIRNSVVSQKVLESIEDCTVVFGCTDNDWSRSILNRFAYQYLVPVIDMGARIVVEHGNVVGASGRVSMIGPGLPCLWCKHHLDSGRIRTESMADDERVKLIKEKYIQGSEVKAPSVISLNSTLASMAVTMLLSSIAGFSVVPAEASEQVYDIMEGVVFRSEVAPNESCTVCGRGGLKGLGMLQRVSGYN